MAPGRSPASHPNSPTVQPQPRGTSPTKQITVDGGRVSFRPPAHSSGFHPEAAIRASPTPFRCSGLHSLPHGIPILTGGGGCRRLLRGVASARNQTSGSRIAMTLFYPEFRTGFPPSTTSDSLHRANTYAHPVPVRHSNRPHKPRFRKYAEPPNNSKKWRKSQYRSGNFARKHEKGHPKGALLTIAY